MKTKKTIKLDFFQLSPTAKRKEDQIDQANAIKTILATLPDIDNLKPLIRTESQVCLYGKLQRRAAFIFGTLVKNQMSEIPPRFNTKTGVINELDLTEWEGLAYATCFLFDPSMNMLMIESIPNGVTAHAFCGFLSKNLDMPGIEPLVVINPVDMQKFMNMTVITDFQVKVAKIENGSVFTNPNNGVAKIMDSADDTDALVLDFKLHAKKNRHTLALHAIKQYVQGFISYKDTEEVQVLKVTGSETDEDPSTMIDFIKQRMHDKIEVERQRLIGTFSISERFDLMDEVFARHRQGLLTSYKIPAK